MHSAERLAAKACLILLIVSAGLICSACKRTGEALVAEHPINNIHLGVKLIHSANIVFHEDEEEK